MLRFLFLFCSLMILGSVRVSAQEWAHIPVAGDQLNMRSGPGLSYAPVGKLRVGQLVDVLQETGEWVQIGTHSGQWVEVERLSDGLTGWVFDYYLAYKVRCKPYDGFPGTKIQVKEGEMTLTYGFRADDFSYYAVTFSDAGGEVYGRVALITSDIFC